MQPRNPYHALVAEAMLQQTQVSRVIEYFVRFIGRFPTVGSLAGAPEAEVMAMWSGLGYYRRARHLHGAAKEIVSHHAGRVPGDVDDLLELPGIGRYTAGAIASIAHGKAEPIVDGNVMRVLLRINGKDLHPGAKSTGDWAWDRAGELVGAATDPAAFNEGLMELGATVCSPPPSTPACEQCPLGDWCGAAAEGLTDRIPRAKVRKAASVVRAVAVVVRRGHEEDAATLLQQRPATGMWASMWQSPTVERESGSRFPTPEEAVERFSHLELRDLVGAASVTHQTTHRTFRIKVYSARVDKPGRSLPTGTMWLRPEEFASVALSSLQHKLMRAASGRR